MGLFFEAKTASPELERLMALALASDPPAAGTAPNVAAEYVAELAPLRSRFEEAVKSTPPVDVKNAAKTQAQAAVDELLGGPSFKTGRFVVALTIFLALVGGGIATEATHQTTSSGTLFGFAGAIFGIVTAFLGSEKGSSQ